MKAVPTSTSKNTKAVDVVIVGAGASGLMCAIEAGKRGRSVVLMDHAHKLAEKIRISGGGRCNFTNLNTKAAHFLSHNPHFCQSALARHTPQHFIALLEKQLPGRDSGADDGNDEENRTRACASSNLRHERVCRDGGERRVGEHHQGNDDEVDRDEEHHESLPTAKRP